MELTEIEKRLIVEALLMKKCFMETGNPVLSSSDLASMGRTKEMRSLDESQKLTISVIDRLVRKFR